MGIHDDKIGPPFRALQMGAGVTFSNIQPIMIIISCCTFFTLLVFLWTILLICHNDVAADFVETKQGGRPTTTGTSAQDPKDIDENDFAKRYAEMPANIEGINDKDTFGNTPLMNAVQSSTFSAIKYLVSAGANVNDKINSDRDTAIFYAAKFGMYRTAIELMKYGAEVNVRNNAGITPLLLALTSNNPDIAIAMLDEGGALPDFPMSNGVYPLLVAAQLNYLHAVEKLVEKGAKIDQRTNTGETSLMFAGVANNAQVMEFLLKHGAKVNIQNNIGLTAVMLAVSRNSIACVQLLLKNDADLSLLDITKRSAYDYAVNLEDGQIRGQIEQAGGKPGKYYLSH